MTLTIPLTPDEELRLVEKAKAEGLTPAEFVRQAIQPIVASQAPPVPAGREKAAAFRKWADSFPSLFPILTLEDISRESMYGRE